MKMYYKAIFYFGLWFSIVLAGAGILFAILILYDFVLNGGKWGYPIWSLADALATVAVAVLIRMGSRTMLARIEKYGAPF